MFEHESFTEMVVRRTAKWNRRTFKEKGKIDLGENAKRAREMFLSSHYSENEGVANLISEIVGEEISPEEEEVEIQFELFTLVKLKKSSYRGTSQCLLVTTNTNENFGTSEDFEECELSLYAKEYSPITEEESREFMRKLKIGLESFLDDE